MINNDYDDDNNDVNDGVFNDINKASIDLPSKPSINQYNDFFKSEAPSSVSIHSSIHVSYHINSHI